MTDTIGNSTSGLRGVDEDATVLEVETAAALLAERASRRELNRSLHDRPAPGRKRWLRQYVILLLSADLVAGLIAASTAYVARRWASVLERKDGYLGQHDAYPEVVLVVVLVWLVVLALSGAYRSKHVASDDRDYRVPVRSAIRLTAGAALFSYLLHVSTSRSMLLGFGAGLIVSVLVCRSIANLVLRRFRSKGRARARVVLVGEGRSVHELAEHLMRRPDDRCEIVGVCAPSWSKAVTLAEGAVPTFGSPDQVLAAVEDLRADTVVVANPSGFREMTLQQVAWQLERDHIDLLVAPDTVPLAGPRLKVSSLRGLPVLQVMHPNHEGLIRKAHFALNRIVAGLLLTVAAPILLLIGVAVALDSPGPVFYRQRRVGYKGKEFDMLKFRSMVVNAEALLPDLLHLNEHDGALFKIKADPRVTRLGRVLRKHSLDELPQLINVLFGEMTLVGPRPCLPREVTMFGEAENRRFMVHPGMTGLWQVSGGPNMPWSEAIKTDLYYVDNWSPTMDLTILARTVRVVAGGKSC